MFRITVLLFFVIFCTVEGEKSVCLSCSTCMLKISSLERKVDELLTLYKSSVCPTGWSTYSRSKSCYHFINSAVTKWQDARQACLAMGGDLVKIESLRENNFVSSLARRNTKATYMWIGLHKDAKKNFVWVDGSAVSGHFTRWSPGEPNNGGGGQEDCVHMYLSNGNWNDIKCNYPNKGVYMCEKRKQMG